MSVTIKCTRTEGPGNVNIHAEAEAPSAPTWVLRVPKPGGGHDDHAPNQTGFESNRHYAKWFSRGPCANCTVIATLPQSKQSDAGIGVGVCAIPVPESHAEATAY